MAHSHNRAEWQPDHTADQCAKCRQPFGLFCRKHHCRGCGVIFCYLCCDNWIVLPRDSEIFRFPQPPSGHQVDHGLERVCETCYSFYRVVNLTQSLVSRYTGK